VTGIGIDYAFFPHPSITAMKNAGVSFVCRYISPDPANDANGKNLLPGECKALLNAGFRVVVVIERGAGWMKGGRAAGADAATHANAVVKALGMPSIPVYGAADWDATPAEQAPINACLDGMAQVLGRNRTGIYGGYYVVMRAFDAGKAHWGWQTLAWSGGQWDKRAHIRQGLSFTLGGASVDHDTAEFRDYGQWPRPAAGTAAYTADGRLTLQQISDHLQVAVGTLVRRTAVHYGRFDDGLYDNLNYLARDPDAAKVAAGTRFWTE
jgi:Rv2525c-like, glycoside hydrolase-like domain